MTDHPTNQQATPMPWDEDEEDRLHDNAVAEAPVERDQAQGENVGLSKIGRASCRERV